jgi:hypothetical protein
MTSGTAELTTSFKVEKRTIPTCALTFSEQTSGWAPEEAVLTTPEVQEALNVAIAEFEAWKNSL